jgi:hypothetical protein
MYRKLVKYDQWHFTEVDPVCVKRLGLKLLDQINRKIRREDDPYRFYEFTIPVLEEAIRGELVESLDLDNFQFVSANYRHDKSEGVLPPEYDSDFTNAVSEFIVAVQGLSLERTEKIIKDGSTYAWLDFEEEGDWPEKVKFR